MLGAQATAAKDPPCGRPSLWHPRQTDTSRPMPVKSAPRATAGAGEPRWTLVVAVLGSSMAFLDGSVVNVALPVMQRSLGATVGQLQWIVEAYALLLASLVLVGGALGDRLGRRA